jgi:hypothetical protein
MTVDWLISGHVALGLVLPDHRRLSGFQSSLAFAVAIAAALDKQAL